tara:strand:+ start:832 stop:1068 length:237 start_codon:yes stop_codon:yes gene_type:complete
MKINLTPYSTKHFLEVSQDDYDRLIQINEKGWSHSSSKEEFMAKLHYLRSGLNQGKINKDSFDELEKKIIVSFWNKGS